MAQKSVPSRQHYDAHYPTVRERAGLTVADELEPEFENRIREIFNGYWAESERPAITAIKKAIEQYISGRAILRPATEALGYAVSEIALAADLVDLSAQDRKEKVRNRIWEILNGWAEPEDPPAMSAMQKALAQYVEGQAIVRAAMETLGPITSEIALAADLVDLSAGDREEKIERYLGFRGETDHLTRGEMDGYGELVPSPPLYELIEVQDRGIGFLKDNPEVLARLLKRQAGDYRKDAERALVVEPALDLLGTVGFTPSKKLTRKAFFDALFDLLGVEQRRRPTPATINVILNTRKTKSRPATT
jgi:hypothetical protein